MSGPPRVYGFHPVREALLGHPEEVLRVAIAEGLQGRRADEVRALCGEQGVAVDRLPAAELERLAGGGVHNGFVALLRGFRRATGGGGDPHLLVLAEDVRDPRNLGALLRVCEGAGVGRVLVRDRGSAPVTPAVARTAAGATEWLPVERITNTAREVSRLQKENFWVYGADAAGVAPWELDLRGPVLLIIGGEERGLRRRTREACDFLVGLPMHGHVASLNLATAAAALLYEAVRQRRAAPLAEGGGDG